MLEHIGKGDCLCGIEMRHIQRFERLTVTEHKAETVAVGRFEIAEIHAPEIEAAMEEIREVLKR